MERFFRSCLSEWVFIKECHLSSTLTCKTTLWSKEQHFLNKSSSQVCKRRFHFHGHPPSPLPMQQSTLLSLPTQSRLKLTQKGTPLTHVSVQKKKRIQSFTIIHILLSNQLSTPRATSIISLKRKHKKIILNACNFAQLN